MSFEVSADGAGLPADMHDGIGLENVRQRLSLACGGQARLSLGLAPGGGCRAELVLPYRSTPE